MSVRVLTTGFWPGQTAPPHINLPRIPAQVLIPLLILAEGAKIKNTNFVPFTHDNDCLGLWRVQELLLGETQRENSHTSAQRWHCRPQCLVLWWPAFYFESKSCYMGLWLHQFFGDQLSLKTQGRNWCVVGKKKETEEEEGGATGGEGGKTKKHIL